MRQSSRKAHSLSDALVNSRLVLLFTDCKLYGRALSLFYYVFCALEKELEASSETLGEKRMLLLRKLYRSKQFQSDLEFYLGAESWRGEAESVRAANPSLVEYEEHLHRLGGDKPLLLLSHAYTQFMAILSGGQILKGLAKRNLKAANSNKLPSTCAFEYPELTSSVSSAKAEFRLIIDDIGLELT